MWMNKETGALLTWRQMLRQYRTEYDGDDTNVLGWREYYEEVDL